MRNLEKVKDIVILEIIIIAVSAFTFNIYLTINDELWNFSNIYKMVNGYEIYKDINVIITPLFFYIGEILFKIFGSNYFIFRVYNVIIMSAFYFLIYKTYSILGIKRVKNIFYLMLIFWFNLLYIVVGASYNLLCMDIFLIGIILMIKRKNILYQSIIMFLIFLCKQNLFIYYAIGLFIYNLLKYKNIKTIIKNIGSTFLITLGLIGVFFIILMCNGNFYNFLNYAFLGMKEFGNKNLFVDDTYIFLFTFALMINFILVFIILYKKINIKKEVKENLKILICFSMASLLIAYPLMNQFHIKLAVVLTIISFIYAIDKCFLEELENKKILNIIKTINFISLIILLTIFFNNTNTYCSRMKNYHNNPVYYGSVIIKDLENNIDNILKYIEETEKEGYDVKIISYTANLYMNILSRNNGDMDLPFHGNLGKEGEDGLIQKIKMLKNTNVLILKDEVKEKYQESKKAIQYIRDNYEQIGEIEDYEIYKVGY